MWTIEYPKDVKTNRHYRTWIRWRGEQNRRLRGIIKDRCRHDLLFYVNSFVMTYDPRKVRKTLPFVTYPFQDRALTTIRETIARTENEDRSEDIVIEKSRDMGASWLSLVEMEWEWHFQEGKSFLMISRKEDLVDASGDPASLFWKIDFVHKNLPEWLRPRTNRSRLHFENEENGSTIDGESTTAASGVGDRRTAIFIDEFSRIEEGSALLAGTADTTRCRIFNFTPYGTASASYALAMRRDIRKLRLHWSEHPEKARGLYRYDDRAKKVDVIDRTFQHGPDFNFILDGKLRSPWYDAECARRGNDREIAVMLDIDYQGSTYQFFDRSLIVELQRQYAVEPYFQGDVSYDTETGKPHGVLPLADGPLKLWTAVKEGRPLPAVYAIGGDLSMGSGSTNSCLSIIDCHTGEKVGEYASCWTRPEKMGFVAVALGWLFKAADGTPAKLAWELQGPGVTFGNKVIELGYRNIYVRTREDTVSKVITEKHGWTPTPDEKLKLLEEYRTALATREFLNRSRMALEETLFFIYLANGYPEHSEQAQGGAVHDPTGARVNHGDRVIADALAWKMCKMMGQMSRKQKKKEERVPLLSLAWRRAQAEKRELEEQPLGF